jgi:hypothetical protein
MLLPSLIRKIATFPHFPNTGSSVPKLAAKINSKSSSRQRNAKSYKGKKPRCPTKDIKS